MRTRSLMSVISSFCIARAQTKRPPLASGLFQFFSWRGLFRQHALALQALSLELAVAADRLGPFAGAPLARLLVMAPELHLAEDAFALHLLLQRLQRLVDIVVANDDLQVWLLMRLGKAGVDNRRVPACPSRRSADIYAPSP